MLSLFKGELSYNEFMWQMPYKDMLALRDARVEQILADRKANEEEVKRRQSETIRNNILEK